MRKPSTRKPIGAKGEQREVRQPIAGRTTSALDDLQLKPVKPLRDDRDKLHNPRYDDVYHFTPFIAIWTARSHCCARGTSPHNTHAHPREFQWLLDASGVTRTRSQTSLAGTALQEYLPVAGDHAGLIRIWSELSKSPDAA
jgi:hypothetical protein